MSDAVAQNPYDRVPYPSLSYAPSHPDRLATIARLWDLTTPPVEQCRVLELGCAVGGNLIPMAYGLPGSEFVGIDRSARQIAQGRETVRALGLRNITLRQMDIREIGSDLGRFDYIIAHGIYSWVPAPVREHLLQVCRENLSPDGVAYVSYNTYPGWRMIEMVREMMLYHTRRTEDPAARAAQARALLDFLAEAVPDENNAYGSFLRMYARLLHGEVDDARPKDDALLLHDELEAVNEPLYFHQFAEQVERHGLRYLADAEFHTMLPHGLPDIVPSMLRDQAGDLIEAEQYLDFVRNRTLRRSLLCRWEVRPNRQLTPDRLTSLYVASRAQALPPDGEEDAASAAPFGPVRRFRASGGATLATDHPVTQAAMDYLAEIWPRAVPFDDLLAEARVRAGPAASAESVDAQVLASNLLAAYGHSDELVELHVYTPPMMLTVSERPKASPVARLQAQESRRVTNLRHERVRLDSLDRYLLRYLDGRHDLAALVEQLIAGPLASGDLVVQGEDGPLRDPARLRETLTEGVAKRLRWLAKAALLIA